MVFNKPLLAAIKKALVELETHTTMVNLFESYDFEPLANNDSLNKLQKAGNYLDHQDWSDLNKTKNLMELLEEFYLKNQDFLDRDLEISDYGYSFKKLHKALVGKDIIWNGGSFSQPNVLKSNIYPSRLNFPDEVKRMPLLQIKFS